MCIAEDFRCKTGVTNNDNHKHKLRRTEKFDTRNVGKIQN